MRPHATDGPAVPDEAASADPRDPAPRPWLDWPVGARVVVRRRLDEGYTDVLGELLASGDDGVRVLTRRGVVDVAAADIALGKIVPAPPVRRQRSRVTGAGDDQGSGRPPGSPL